MRSFIDANRSSGFFAIARIADVGQRLRDVPLRRPLARRLGHFVHDHLERVLHALARESARSA